MLASLIGLDHKAIPADTGQLIHVLRAKAVSMRIDLEDLLRVLLKLAKRRGYAGGFKIKTEKQKDDDKSVVKPGIEKLEAAMQAADCKTVGQYLQLRFKNGETLKLKEVGLYSHRDMLEAEFDAIWSEQEKHHAILKEAHPDPVFGGTRPIREQFREAIFYQRPLKSVAPMVGNCMLEPNFPRAPMAQLAMQAFRIEKQLADLRWGMGRSAASLSPEQKSVIRDMLNDPDEITKEGKLIFKKIYTALEKKALRPANQRSLNMERSSREELSGNRTLRAMRDLGILEQWQSYDATTQLRIINFLADLGSPEQVDAPNWQDRFTKIKRIKNAKTGRWEEKSEKRVLDANLVKFINTLVDSGKFDRLGNMGFESGRASYSIRALENLTKRMRDDNCDEYTATQVCYPPPKPTGELLTHLPPHAPTGNVVVDVALGAVRRAVNEALAKLGEPPAEVIIELSRDMALGLKARGEIEKRIDKNRKQRDNAKKEIEKLDKIATERNVLRYLLWEQQDKRRCAYCSDPINCEQAFDGNTTHFEHILPRSLTRVGKQRNHLVLAHRRCNDAKGDRTPYEAFEHDEDRWKAVEYCASVLKDNKQFAKAKLLILQDYEHETLDDAAIGEFTERQLHETSWIGKLTAQWLQATCPTPVAVSRGALTAHLRRIWKLETVIAQARFDAGLPVLDQDAEKISLDDFKRFKPHWEGHNGKGIERTDRKIDKRIDHRHHLIDALVIAQTSRGLYQRMAKHYKELAEKREAGENVRMKLFVEPPLGNVREQALELVRNAEIRHKPDRHGDGAFFQEFAYGTTSFDDDTRLYLSRRKKVSGLANKKDSVDKVRKQIESIVSHEVRRLVSAAFEARLLNGKTPFESLQDPIEYPVYRNHIKSVMCATGLAEDSSRIVHESRTGSHTKMLVDDGWACLMVRNLDGKKIETRLLSPRIAANKRARIPQNGETIFFKGDTVVDTYTKKTYLIRQIKAQAGGLLVMTPAVDAREVRDMSATEGLKMISGKGLLKIQHKEHGV
jgi:CRISPR-associated endonuclease Csn1